MIEQGLIDTHAHMCDSVFDSDLPEVLERARACGVSAILCVSENLSEAERNVELGRRYPMLLPAAGLAPSMADRTQADRVSSFIRREQSMLRAIGEVGLDFWMAKEEHARDLQREVFQLFIDLAVELDLPLNVHSRSAGRKVIDLLIRRGAKRVQLHAFDGKASSALSAVEAGYFFSIPPSVVRSIQKQKLVRSLPLERLLVETDSPVLGPTRGVRNEPANVIISLDTLATIKSVRKEEVIEAVTRNARMLYK